LSATLRVAGTQGHVAYPERGANPIHLALPALHALSTTRWDEGNAAFPPTSLQITEVRAGVGADNVVPGELMVRFNLRYLTASNQPGSEAGDHGHPRRPRSVLRLRLAARGRVLPDTSWNPYLSQARRDVDVEDCTNSGTNSLW
jgi:acetylornithine deacetylase/succinyl-diaminopimelate desuccinylase-like protein